MTTHAGQYRRYHGRLPDVLLSPEDGVRGPEAPLHLDRERRALGRRPPALGPVVARLCPHQRHQRYISAADSRQCSPHCCSSRYKHHGPHRSRHASHRCATHACSSCRSSHTCGQPCTQSTGPTEAPCVQSIPLTAAVGTSDGGRQCLGVHAYPESASHSIRISSCVCVQGDYIGAQKHRQATWTDLRLRCMVSRCGSAATPAHCSRATWALLRSASRVQAVTTMLQCRACAPFRHSSQPARLHAAQP